LSQQIDAFGNPVPQPASGILDLGLNPFRPSNSRTTPLTDELGKLKAAGQPIYPTTEKTIKVGDETIKLTPQQQEQYNTLRGQEIDLIWNNITGSDEYKNLGDAQKKAFLANAQEDINTVQKKKYLESIGRKDLADKIDLSKRQKKYADGTIAATTWLPKDLNGGGSTTNSIGDDVPKDLAPFAKQWIAKYENMDSEELKKAYYDNPAAEFEYKAAQYEKDLANKKLTKAQEISKRSELAALQAGKDTPKDIRELYGLSKAQLYPYLTTDANGESIAQQLLTYGDRLVAAGASKQNKFKTSKGAVDFDPQSNKRSGSSRTSRASYKAPVSTLSFEDALWNLINNAKVKG